jgi:hypothetical protein
MPEDLIVRGAGRQIRIRLDRLEHAEELVAQVEVYARALQRPVSGTMRPAGRGRPTQRLAPLPDDEPR